jgi:hypothetical protein
VHFLSLALPFFLFRSLLFHLLQVIVNVLGVVQFLSSEIAFEEGSFESVAELDFFVLDHGAFAGGALEVLESIDSAVVFAPVLFVPLDADPQLVLAAGRHSLVLQLSKIPDYSCAVVEEDLPAHQLFSVCEVVCFESFGLCLKIEGLDLVQIFLLLG